MHIHFNQDILEFIVNQHLDSLYETLYSLIQQWNDLKKSLQPMDVGVVELLKPMLNLYSKEIDSLNAQVALLKQELEAARSKGTLRINGTVYHIPDDARFRYQRLQAETVCSKLKDFSNEYKETMNIVKTQLDWV